MTWWQKINKWDDETTEWLKKIEAGKDKAALAEYKKTACLKTKK